jgi:hypothetical protein
LTHFAHLLRIASTIACGIVLVAFAAWATDETKSASTQQAATVESTTPAPSAPVATAPEPEHDGIRGAIESANDTLVAPFDDVVASSNDWVQHGVPALLALLAYGLLGRLLIAYLPR